MWLVVDSGQTERQHEEQFLRCRSCIIFGVKAVSPNRVGGSIARRTFSIPRCARRSLRPLVEAAFWIMPPCHQCPQVQQWLF
ncbi:hypothetical protein OAL44_01170 [Planctomycetaceae bacterium]|nr:hypothetical protein [Planctomycetaceae bacterium]